SPTTPLAGGTLMPTRRVHPVSGQRRDVGAAPIVGQCQVEQIAVSKEHRALPSRLRQQGQVLGRGHHRLSVRVERDDQLISLRPHPVGVLDTAPGGC
ncbi:MAG: hypothetical protein ACRDUV_08700, partial [Pseudonocardiaceae bacterium]